MDDLMQDICPRFEDEDLPWDLSDHDDDVPLPSPSPVPRRDASFHDGETLAPQSEIPAPRSRTPLISAHNAPYERERHTATEQNIHGGHINMRRPSRWDSQPSHNRPSTSRNTLSERKGPFKHKPNYPPHHHARKFQQYSHRQPDDLGRLLNSVQAYQATLDRHGCLIEEQDRTIKEMNGKLDALTEHTYTQSKLINTQHELLNKVFSHIEILSQRPSPPERQSYDRPTFYLSGPFYPNDGPRYFGGTSSERHDVEPLWHPAFFVEDDQVQERKRPDDRGTINHVPSDRPPHHRNPSGHRRPPLYERISSGDSPLEPRSGRHGRQNGGGYQSKDTPRGTASKRAHPSHAPSPFRQAGSLPPAYSEVPPDAPSLLQRVEPRIPSLKRKYSSYSREEDRIWQPAASWTRRHSNQSPRTFPMPEPPVSLSARIGEYVR